MPSKTTSPSVDPRLWSTNPLSPWILEGVATMGFAKMTPVQASAIPLFLANKDVVVEAVTGSGKTLAFLIPVIERLLAAKEGFKKGHVGGIIISPTRELAMQIFNVCESLLKFYPTSIDNNDGNVASSCPIHPQLLVAGGTTPAQDLKAFLSQSSNLLIATPGRLNDLLASPYAHTSSFEVLVLDEADRLLDLGFKETLMKILSRLPKQRRTGLFSASITDAVEGVMGWVGIRNGVRVNVKVKGFKDEERRTPASLDIGYLPVKASQKLFYIPQIISSTPIPPQKVIVYLATCHAVDYFSHLVPVILPSYNVIPLHGKQTPNARTRNFNTFSSSTSPSLLLTTDLAARGLDIPSVDLVIQLDPPQDPKQFLHRCGRSGRAGRKGRAVLLLTSGKEEDYISFLQVRKTPIRLLSSGTDNIHSPSQEFLHRGFTKIRKTILGDRAIYEKSLRAFVSWVRSYKSHVADASIFRIEDLDWQDVARGWCLVTMPRMPETKHLSPPVDLNSHLIPVSNMKDDNDGHEMISIDPNSIAFKDKTREKLRLQQIELEKTDGFKSQQQEKKVSKQDREKKNAPWSVKVETKEEREMRRGKKRKRKEMEKVGKMTVEEKEKDDEWKSLVEEAKKLKKKEAEEREMEWEGFED